MERGYLEIFILCLSLSYGVASIELLASYKYWKSVSDQLTYDYSGNSRHGILSGDYIVTDRGLSPNNYYYPSFMNYNNPGLVNYTFSFWISNNSSGLFFISLFPDSEEIFFIHYNLSTNFIEIVFQIYLRPEAIKKTTINMFLGWNLHTISVNLDSSNTNRLNFHLYKNLEHLHSNFLDAQLQFTKLDVCNLGNLTESITLGPILNELWIHTGFTNISDLSNLLSIYSCPSSPSAECLPTHPPTMNKLGQTCPSECTSNNQSCDITLNCITKNKSGCQYGLYDLETSQCLFYCPNSSCICPGPNIDLSQTYNAYSFSCIAGYEKISDNLPSCMSKRCLSYNKVGYEYICITFEYGYTLDASGNCCICISEFTQVSTTPLICVNTLVCTNYIISGGDYTCSNCAEGFVIDSEGKCNKCSSNYVNVLDNPFTCALKIENCRDYIYNGFNLICQICNEGYSVDENLMCNQCESGYFLLLTSPFTCILEVEHCVSYEKEGEGWKCMECTGGYQLGISEYCDECKPGYVRIESEIIKCMREIEYCIIYELYSEDFKCNVCEIGYAVGTDYKCSACNEGYIEISLNPLICVMEIEHCIRYKYINDMIKCSECESDYVLLSECVPEIPSCNKYAMIKDQYICVVCQEGYDIDDDNKCSKCAKGYTNDEDKCVPETSYDNQVQASDISSSDEEEDITQAQIDRGKMVSSSNFITTNTALASTFLSSLICLDTNTLILYMNTIQLISYIQYLNIPLPFEINKQQSSTNDFMSQTNILSYMKIEDRNLNSYIRSSLDDQYSFLANSIYTILTLLIVIAQNVIVYLCYKFGKGKVKEKATRLLRYFKYTIYIQLYITTYLNIIYTSLSKLTYVIYNQPNEDSILNILDYNLAILFSVTMI